MTPRSRLLVGFGVWLIGFAMLGLPQAMGRHFHVDEFQVAYNTALWGVHDRPDFTNYAAPYMVPLSHLIGGLGTSAEMLFVLRLVFLGVFSLILIAGAWAQPYFQSSCGRLCVLAALTAFHPLWLNGHEIRHDAIVVLGAVVLYALAQRVAAGATASWLFVVGGVVSATMQTNSFKAIVYWPVLGGLLVLLGTRAAWAGRSWTRLRPAASFLVGLAVGVALNVGAVIADRKLAPYLKGLAPVVNNASKTERFTPTNELVRLAIDSPVVFGFGLCACVLFASDVARRRATIRSALTIGCLAWALATLYLNPRPFPYNHMHVLPFVAFAALDAADRLKLAERHIAIVASAALAAMFVFVHAWMTDAYLRRTNLAQLSYVAAAEVLTGPNDTILDGVGLVLTRRPPHPHWMIHSLWRSDYDSGRRTSFADIMKAHPSPVMLDNYRWAWLSSKDLAMRNARYLRVAPHLLVLGQRLAPGAGELVIHYAGRYRVGAAAPLQEGVHMDGKLLGKDGVVELTIGTHAYELAGEEEAALQWMGPNLSPRDTISIASLGQGEWFFMNEPMPFGL